MAVDSALIPGIGSGLMTRCAPRLLFSLGLLAVLVGLTPLAYASPPDPVWVSGFFDDDDNDNGVFFVTSSHATLDPFPLYSWSLVLAFWPGLVLEDRGPVVVPYIASADARAPPIS